MKIVSSLKNKIRCKHCKTIRREGSVIINCVNKKHKVKQNGNK